MHEKGEASFNLRQFLYRKKVTFDFNPLLKQLVAKFSRDFSAILNRSQYKTVTDRNQVTRYRYTSKVLIVSFIRPSLAGLFQLVSVLYRNLPRC